MREYKNWRVAGFIYENFELTKRKLKTYEKSVTKITESQGACCE